MSSRLCFLLGSAALLIGTGVAPVASADEHQMTEHLNRQQFEYGTVARSRSHQRLTWVRRWVWDNFWGDYHLVWVPRITTYRTVSYTPHRRTHIAMSSDGRGKSASSKSREAANGNSDKDMKTSSVSGRDSSAPDAAKSYKDTKTASVAPMARPRPPASANDNTKLASIDTHAKPGDAAEKPDAKIATEPTKSVAPGPKLQADLTKPVTPAEMRSAVPIGKVDDPKQTLASAPIKSVWGATLGKVRDMDVSGNSVKTVDATLDGRETVKIDASRLKYVKSRNLLITTLSKEDAAKLPKADRS